MQDALAAIGIKELDGARLCVGCQRWVRTKRPRQITKTQATQRYRHEIKGSNSSTTAALALIDRGKSWAVATTSRSAAAARCARDIERGERGGKRGFFLLPVSFRVCGVGMEVAAS